MNWRKEAWDILKVLIQGAGIIIIVEVANNFGSDFPMKNITWGETVIVSVVIFTFLQMSHEIKKLRELVK